MIVDAHLDLGYNVQKGRDLRLPAAETRAKERRESQECMVSFPDMRDGDVALVFGSTFAMPSFTRAQAGGEFDSKMSAASREQVGIYNSWEDEGLVRIIRGRSSLESHLVKWADDGVTGLLIAMESAEPIETPSDIAWWYERGVRMIGPAWGPTRYCGGHAGPTGHASGYTDLGAELLSGMKRLGIILDLAHSSVECFQEAVDSDLDHVVYTHTTPREVSRMDRMPDRDMMATIGARGGIVGLGMGNVFLDPDARTTHQMLPLSVVGDVFSIMADGAGWEHIGIGSDLDGGIGVKESPVGLDSIADLGKVGSVVPAEHADNVLGGNWIRFLRQALPDD